jgi:TonB family protein
MAHKRTWAALVAALAACVQEPPAVAPPPPPAVAPPPPAPPPPAISAAPPDVVAAPTRLLDDYKRRLAVRIVAANPKVFHERLPRLMKSIVVLHIRVDSHGRPLQVTVFRSNGYRALEQRAVASVIMAMPLPAPPAALLDDQHSLSFLETFLFRDDGLFQVRSLVGETWKATAASP